MIAARAVGLVVEGQRAGEPPSAVVVVRRDQGLLELPGGPLSAGETAADGWRRHVHEQTGLVVDVLDRVDVGDGVEFLLGRAVLGRLRSAPGSRALWVSWPQLPAALPPAAMRLVRQMRWTVVGSAPGS